MSHEIELLEPKPFWKYFADLSAIPRGSKNEKEAGEWVKKVASDHSLEYKQDDAGNIVVRVPATPGHENAQTVILQGHLDMVHEKNSDVDFDFEKDGIRLKIEDGWITADGTTLGADNGVGVAASLAVLDSPEVVHGPLELLFTVDEETGLTGASALRTGFVTGKRMLNLDSEDDKTFYIGCAGGSDAHILLPLNWESPPDGTIGVKILVTGLSGGHSGLNIVENRGNAIRLLTRILARTGRRDDYLGLASIEGGSKHNAIPREAWAVFTGDGQAIDVLKQAAKEELTLFREEFGSSDPDARAELSEVKKPDLVVDVSTRDRLLGTLLGLPNGVLSMSRDMPGLVETSTNLAVVRLDDDYARIHMSSRSSVSASVSKTNWQIAAVAGLAGAQVEMGGSYPGWKPDMNSHLLKIATETYRDLRGSGPEVTAIHAGLECGIIGERFPGMDMISFGPTIEGAHSPEERMNIASAQRFWELLRGMLAVLA